MTDSNKEFQALDTTVVQVRSVLNYMYTLGYQLDTSVKSARFVTNIKELQGNRYVSFQSAVRLHNSTDEQWSLNADTGEARPDGVIKFARSFNVLGVRLAQASKLVKQVKLSVDKYGRVLTLDVMVVPLNKVVQDLLGL